MTSSKRLARFLALGVGAAAMMFANVANAAGISLIRDTEIEEMIRKDSDPILKASGLNPKAVRFYLVNSNEVNAFVAGGQNIFIHTGLIAETETPNQLLGVIAHEAGHISGGHIIRQGDMMRAGMAPFLLTMGLGIAAALAGQGQAGAALMASSQYFGVLSVLRYSRVQEAAADQAAVSALDEAGLSSRGLVEFFDTFRNVEVFSGQERYQFFRSHPLSSDRIEILRRRAAEMPNYEKVDSPEKLEEYKLLKAKLDAFMKPPQQTFVRFSEKDPSFIARYARAIAYYRAGESERALTGIEALLAERPNDPYLWELKGQVLFDSGRAALAVEAHKRSVELKPDAPLLRVNYGQSLIATESKEHLDAAIVNLRRAIQLEQDNTFAWTLLAQAYEAKGMPGEARLATAEARFWAGNLQEAKTFAMRAREHLEKGKPDWVRATDIVLSSEPTDADLKELARDSRGS